MLCVYSKMLTAGVKTVLFPCQTNHSARDETPSACALTVCLHHIWTQGWRVGIQFFCIFDLTSLEPTLTVTRVSNVTAESPSNLPSVESNTSACVGQVRILRGKEEISCPRYISGLETRGLCVPTLQSRQRLYKTWTVKVGGAQLPRPSADPQC